MNIHSPGYRFRRGTGSPFDATMNEDIDLGGTDAKPVRWCEQCHMEVRTASESYNQHQVWGQKHWCRRCGAVVASAVYFHARNIAFQPVELLHKAIAWAATNEQKG